MIHTGTSTRNNGLDRLNPSTIVFTEFVQPLGEKKKKACSIRSMILSVESQNQDGMMSSEDPSSRMWIPIPSLCMILDMFVNLSKLRAPSS